MKHTIITGALLLASVASNAQEASTPTSGTSLTFKSKNGHEVLPQAKDWALGISATSFLNYFGKKT